MKKLQKADYIKMYSFMLKIRRFEERAAQLYGMGKIGGFCHLYIGQEAVVVGILMTIDKNDSVVTTYSCLLYTSPSPRDDGVSRMPSSA